MNTEPNNYRREQHETFLRAAEGYARLSPDPSTKVGAVLVNEGRIVAGAWNSFPASMVGRNDLYQIRERKYERIIHAELRCCIQGWNSCKGAWLYTTLPPCSNCAKHIADVGVSRVLFFQSAYEQDWVRRSAADVNLALNIFAECFIQVTAVP
jgi:dCMP deaminase